MFPYPFVQTVLFVEKQGKPQWHRYEIYMYSNGSDVNAQQPVIAFYHEQREN